MGYKKLIRENLSHWGFFSWKWKKKCKIEPSHFVDFINQNPNNDVYIMNWAPYLEAVSMNVWTQGDLNHNNISNIAFAILKEMNYNTITQIPNLCLHIAGSTLLKGTKQLIDIWISKRIKAPLIITAYNNNFSNDNLFSYWKTHNPVVKELPKEIMDFFDTKVKLPIFENCGSIYFCKDELSDKVIKFLQHSADIHIYPSLIEEWGQIIDEARQSKACILTLDAPPMNELIDDKSGIQFTTSSILYSDGINTRY